MAATVKADLESLPRTWRAHLHLDPPRQRVSAQVTYVMSEVLAVLRVRAERRVRVAVEHVRYSQAEMAELGDWAEIFAIEGLARAPSTTAPPTTDWMSAWRATPKAWRGIGLG
jgi:hypothetical protein